MAPHSSTLAWRIPWMEEPGRLQSLGLLRVGHDWATSLSLSCIGEGNGNPLPYSCLENPREGGAWRAAFYGVAQSRTRLKWLSSSRLVIAFLPRSKHLSWLQSPSAVILEPQTTKSITVSIISPSIFYEVMGPDAMILVLLMLSFKLTLWFYSFSFIKRVFSSSLLSARRVKWSAYLRLLIFLLAILIPACVLSSLAFHMMHSAYKLNKQGDNTQHWCTPFPIWKQFIVPFPVLTVASWPAYRFLRRQVKWSGIPFSLGIFPSIYIDIYWTQLEKTTYMNILMSL